MPTLPTPTTLRAAWTSVNWSSRCRRSDCRVRRYLPSTARTCSYSALACTSANSSSSGTISGGSLMIRRRPSTTVVSLHSACVLSRVWALASIFSASVNPFAFIWDRNCADGLLDVQMRVPHVQERLLREPAHRRPVALRRR